MEDFEIAGAENRCHGLKRIAQEGIERIAIVVEIDEDEAVFDFGLDLAQPAILGVEPAFLIALGHGDADAFALAVECPMVEQAGKGLPVARRLAQDFGAAMRADVIEGADFAIVATDVEKRFAGDGHGAEIADFGHFAFMAGELPNLGEDFLLLLAENIDVGIDTVVDIMAVGKAGRRPPFRSVLCRHRRPFSADSKPGA